MPPPNAHDPSPTTDHVPAPLPEAPNETVTFQPRPGEQRDGPSAPPPSIPGYEIEAVLGRGGMGVVYKARHLALKRTVALKMVLAGGHAGPRELARFRVEAEAAARLQHPNIVQIHEAGEAGGHPYCALEFVEGGNLAGKLDGKPMPAREAAKLVETLARAMQLAHSRNVVHRDLKPANILLAADGTPKITDFGLARRLDNDSSETQAGAVMGTPSYMAPEQASGLAHEAGPAADVYALGAILYDCVAGRPPFKGKTVVETLDQVRTQEPAPPSRCQPGVPLDLETICLKCLRKEPEKRYASAAELADELVRYQHGEPIQARPVGRIERAFKWVKRNPVVTAMAAAVVLALAAGATVSYLKYRDAEQQKGIAEKQTEIAQGKEKEAKDEAAEAEKALRVAVSQTDLSFDALGDLVLKIQIDLDEAPGGRHVRQELLEDTMRKLNRLVESPATSDRLFRRYASAHMQLGEILWGLNRRSEAEQEYKKAGEYSERAFQADPTSDKAKANIAANNNRMGDTELFYHKRLEPARKLYEAALPLWQGLADKMVAFPDGDPALPELERISLIDAEEAVADTCDRLGIVSLRFDFDYARAEEWFTQSLEIRKRHVEKDPSHAHRVALGASYIYLAELALQHDEPDKALKLHEELLKQREATFAERGWSLKARRNWPTPRASSATISCWPGETTRATECTRPRATSSSKSRRPNPTTRCTAAWSRTPTIAAAPVSCASATPGPPGMNSRKV